jgi:hypothetical protein
MSDSGEECRFPKGEPDIENSLLTGNAKRSVGFVGFLQEKETVTGQLSPPLA